MADLRIETTISVVSDVDTDDFPIDYSMDDILGHFQGLAKETVIDGLDQDIAHITTRTLEVVHTTDGS